MHDRTRTACKHSAETLRNIADRLESEDNDLGVIERMSTNLLEVKKTMDRWIYMDKIGGIQDIPE